MPLKEPDMAPPSFSHRTAKMWIRISIELVPEMTDAAGAFLAELTAGGVEIAAAAASGPIRERVIGYLEADGNMLEPEKQAALQAFIADLQENFPAAPPPVLHTDCVREQDWSEGWKHHFKPLRITPRLVIKPTWERYEPAPSESRPGEAVIEMDPGLAFGTGHHASTRLALTLIDALFANKGDVMMQQVLDVGTGTGILAMACGLFGARHVLAIDNDPDAVEAARNNVAANGLASIVRVSGQEAAELDSCYDLIVANIVLDVLRDMAPILTRLLAQAGRLIIAGILQGDQEQSIASIYTGYGLALVDTKTSEEWVAMLFCKTSM